MCRQRVRGSAGLPLDRDAPNLFEINIELDVQNRSPGSNTCPPVTTACTASRETGEAGLLSTHDAHHEDERELPLVTPAGQSGRADASLHT